MNNWFEVDLQGLAQLQAGKPKTFIINELCQNALDENITFCKLTITHSGNTICVSVEDDSPEGFRNITHAYTLFADTYKRKDPSKRGRFNLGEKQVISICNRAMVETTKGTVIFDQDGRKEIPEKKTSKGSIITIWFNGTEDEYKEMLAHTKTIIAPENVTFIVNNQLIPTKKPFKTFETSLDTEILKNGQMALTTHKTAVKLFKSDGRSFIYEIGIPVMETDCPWHIDIQQKIPLAVDRETVRPYYLKDLYAAVLNNTYNDVSKDDISAVWIRTGMQNKTITKEAVQSVMVKRFGDKVLSRSPFDANANDEATSKGYTIITGNQMSKEEWDAVRRFEIIETTSDKFGKSGLTDLTNIEPEGDRKTYADFVKRVAKEYFGFDITVNFVKSNINAGAYYGGRTLTYNLSKLPKDFFVGITKQNLDLMIHELGHEEGNHTEHDYHKCITNLAGWLIMKALKDPQFFEVD